MDEWFTVVRGRVGFRIDGRDSIAEPGERMHVPAGTVHDWWNAGDEEALIIVKIDPGVRFEEMIVNLFRLAQHGKTNTRGMPNLLQAALFAREFDDVPWFTRPPRIVQKILFGALAPVARLLGYRGSYPEYLSRRPSETATGGRDTRLRPTNPARYPPPERSRLRAIRFFRTSSSGMSSGQP